MPHHMEITREPIAVQERATKRLLSLISLLDRGPAKPKKVNGVPPKPRLKPLPGGTKRAAILKRPYVATLDQVNITREGDTAVIEYAEEGVWGTYLRIGPELTSMTDEDVLALFNGGIEAAQEHRNTIDLPAIEIPVGKPQIEWSADAHHWLARGHVLRCVIHDDENRQPRVIIDDKDLSWEQFGQVVVTFAGWGAHRLCR